MFLLENILNKHHKDLSKLTFHLDEANTDKSLKEFVKKIILKKLTIIPEEYLNYKLSITFQNKTNQLILFSDFKNVFIQNVYLQNEITQEIKNKIKLTKTSIWTNPDLLLEINYNSIIYLIPIELKSTKTNNIPGSSIQQINPNNWVIFIKHSTEKIEVITGQYINTINKKIPFPDRSPRPQISFNELQAWNQKNRIISNSLISYNIDNENKEKQDILQDWQKVLASNWINIIFNNQTKKTESWFNNNLRKFVLLFLEKYELLSNEEKEKFKNELIKKIK